MGDKGSPCRSPLLWKMVWPGLPLRSTWVDAEASNLQTISHQTGPKPKCCITYNKKGQETESKAFVISNFKRILASLCWCNNLAVCWTSMKLSKIDRPLMKALWLWDTILSRCPESLLAISLVMSFANEWTRLMGRKSLTFVASSFLGSRVM